MIEVLRVRKTSLGCCHSGPSELERSAAQRYLRARRIRRDTGGVSPIGEPWLTRQRLRGVPRPRVQADHDAVPGEYWCWQRRRWLRYRPWRRS